VQAIRARLDALEAEASRLLSEYGALIGLMEHASGDSGGSSTAASAHVLSRCRDVEHEARMQLNKSKRKLTVDIQRVALCEGGGDFESQGGSSVRPRTELLLREKNSLHNSIHATDDAINIAISARNELKRSQTILGGVAGKISTLGSSFPSVNNMIGRISNYKRRDMLVMSTVLAICMLLTLARVAGAY
jgi:Golgi SNAP receptor complex protein 1